MLMREFAHRHHVGEDLRGVEFIGQPVEHRHAGKLSKHFGIILTEATILDPVIEATEHSGGVFDRFLVADMATRRSQIGDMRALIMGRDFEPAAGACAVLLEDQRDILTARAMGRSYAALLSPPSSSRPGAEGDVSDPVKNQAVLGSCVYEGSVAWRVPLYGIADQSGRSCSVIRRVLVPVPIQGS
jgi:hypothetical protein